MTSEGGATAAHPKPATASREDNLAYDLKHLAAFDISPLHPQTNFLEYTRDSVQLLVNQIFALPQQKSDVGTTAELPSLEVFKLPRTKPIPKVEAKTRWEKFMESRNMRKRKRSRLVWDETSGDWKPRWGYKSAKKSEERAQNAVMEVKDGDDPFENPFEKQRAEKKLLVAKQKMREVRNKVEALGGKLRASVPDLQRNGEMKRGKDGLREAVKRAQASSASMGKFDSKAPYEATNLQAKQKKGVNSMSPGAEKDRYMKAANKLFSGDGQIDRDKAAKAGASGNRHETKIARTQKGSKRRSKQGGKKGKR